MTNSTPAPLWVMLPDKNGHARSVKVPDSVAVTVAGMLVPPAERGQKGFRRSFASIPVIPLPPIMKDPEEFSNAVLLVSTEFTNSLGLRVTAPVGTAVVVSASDPGSVLFVFLACNHRYSARVPSQVIELT